MNFELLAATEGRPLNYGPILHASAHAKITGSCGDTLQFWLKIDGDRIRKASFVSDGCEDSVICCSIAAHMVEGMRLEEAATLTQASILAKAPPIRNDHRHCALLAANTIKQAIETFTNEPPKVPLKQKLKQFTHHEKHNHGNSGHSLPSQGGRHD